jgi:hypothetical protein
MPLTFPNIPIDENLFDSNYLMEEYWERSVAPVDYVSQNERVEEIMVSALTGDFAEMKQLTEQVFGKMEVSQTPVNDEIQNEETVVEPVIPALVEAPIQKKLQDAIVKPLTTSESGLSSGQILALVILVLLLLWLVFVLINNSGVPLRS